MNVISPELRAWLRPGLAGMLATAGDDGRPEATRIWAARLHEGRDVLELSVHRSGSSKLLQLVASGSRAAANLIDVRSYRSRMFTGRCTLANVEVDQAHLDECLAAAQAAFETVGMPGDALRRMLSHYDEPRSMTVLLLEVENVFDQSPKRGAGARL